MRLWLCVAQMHCLFVQAVWVGELGSNTSLLRLDLENNRLTDVTALKAMRMLSGDPSAGRLQARRVPVQVGLAAVAIGRYIFVRM